MMNAKLSDVASPDMNDAPVMLPINAVERETGVSKELLRMWERRYHFPHPGRDGQGDRIYPMEQVNKLRLLRRLIDAGFRPGKIIELDTPELEKLLRSQSRNPVEMAPEIETELLEVLQSRDAHRVREYLSHQMIKLGLQTFILNFLQHANFIVGDAWARGVLEIHEEHLYTEQVQALIRGAITNLRAASEGPHIMLTTAPEESHILGILMVEAMLRLDNVDAICFGAQMPVRDIAQAALKHKMHIVALSFSASYPTSKAIEFLEELRFRLPLTVKIWAGGSSLRSTRRSVEDVDFFHDLDSIKQAVLQWRRQQGGKQ
ncbi:MAG: MerR family transcriptional regulator [Moraxellaceae bacterium]|nr:MerR family transcriptional regulator [Moraxellaceae bacterium]